LVACEDAYELTVALFAVMQANCQAVLPAHFQSGHLNELAARVDGVVASAGIDVAGARVLRVPVEPAGHMATAFRPLDSNTAEIVLYTAGTTGGPLPVRKPLRCFESEIEVLEQVFAPPSNAVVLATVPVHHIYGLLFRVFWPIATKRTFSGTVIRFPEDLTAALEAGGRQILVSSPAFLKRALPVLDLGRLSSTCCQIFSSGGPLPPEVAARYNAVLREPIREVYGSTETGGIAYRSVFSAGNPEPWTPFPGVELSLDKESGVLKVQSPNLPEQNSVSTGDKVRMLAKNRFVLTGRADRIVKIEQQRISLSDLERRLTELPEVNGARVLIRNSSEGRRDILAAVIEPSPQGWSRLLEIGKRQMREHLCASLRPHVSTLALPRKWRFLRRIPEDARGKTPLSSLEALWDPSAYHSTKPEVFAREEGQDSLTLNLRPPEDLLFFDGHFGQQPVLAGVAQLSWAIDIAQQQFQINEAFRQVSALKFHHVIRPVQEIELTLSFDRSRNRVRFQFSRAGKELSSGFLLFGNAL
jgi:acyl-coenzyme A synthetase/AMP-(fatty) acid ligase